MTYSDALFALPGVPDKHGVVWAFGTVADVNPLLAREHYLGPVVARGDDVFIIGERDGIVVAAQVWRRPSARALPADGTWLELSRWCLTPGAGRDAGSRMHGRAVKLLRDLLPGVTTLVSYSDPAAGHTGSLYLACNWLWVPTWLRLRPPPSGNGVWDRGPAAGQVQSVKDRWVFPVRPDPARERVLTVGDPAAVRFWAVRASEREKRMARHHGELAAELAVRGRTSEPV